MLERLSVVLVRTKYPENIGSAARACLNMGVSDLVLVDPQNLNLDKALPLATVHAKSILEGARLARDLDDGLAGAQLAIGTTARTGGWRKGIMSPEKAAEVVCERLAAGDRVALVFGPEDKGLTNEETGRCTSLCCIPTARAGTSLNLAQAVLLLLYECFRRSLATEFRPAGPPPERACTVAEVATLQGAMRQALLAAHFLRKDNPDYWMLPLKRFMARIRLARHEFNLLMGICRQITWLAGRAGLDPAGGGGGTDDASGGASDDASGGGPDGASAAAWTGPAGPDTRE
ncbi:MAG: RNA methyltransferase [Desulfovibrionaceae bacterium]